MLLPVQEASVFHSIPPPMIQTAVSDYLLSGLSRSLDSNPDGDSYPPGLDAVLKYYGLSTATPGQYRPGCAFQKRYGHQVTAKDVCAFLSYRTTPESGPVRQDDFETFLIRHHGLTARSGDSSSGTGRTSRAGWSPGHRAPGPPVCMEEEDPAALPSLAPWIVRIVCVCGLVLLFLTENLGNQRLLALLLAGGALFSHRIGEKIEDGISVPRRIVLGVLLVLILTGTVSRFWILTVLLVLAFFQFS